MDLENSANFPYEKSLNVNSKGFVQIAMKAKSDQPIDNKKLVSDFKAFRKAVEKEGYKIQKEEIKK